MTTRLRPCWATLVCPHLLTCVHRPTTVGWPFSVKLASQPLLANIRWPTGVELPRVRARGPSRVNARWAALAPTERSRVVARRRGRVKSSTCPPVRRPARSRSTRQRASPGDRPCSPADHLAPNHPPESDPSKTGSARKCTVCPLGVGTTGQRIARRELVLPGRGPRQGAHGPIAHGVSVVPSAGCRPPCRKGTPLGKPVPPGPPLSSGPVGLHRTVRLPRASRHRSVGHRDTVRQRAAPRETGPAGPSTVRLPTGLRRTSDRRRGLVAPSRCSPAAVRPSTRPPPRVQPRTVPDGRAIPASVSPVPVRTTPPCRRSGGSRPSGGRGG